MPALTFTPAQVLELAEAFEARADRAQVVIGGGRERCVTAETLRDCAAQVRRFAAMPPPARTEALKRFLEYRSLDVEAAALALEVSARELPPRHAQIARDAVQVLRRFLDLERAAR